MGVIVMSIRISFSRISVSAAMCERTSSRSFTGRLKGNLKCGKFSPQVKYVSLRNSSRKNWVVCISCWWWIPYYTAYLSFFCILSKNSNISSISRAHFSFRCLAYILCQFLTSVLSASLRVSVRKSRGPTRCVGVTSSTSCSTLWVIEERMFHFYFFPRHWNDLLIHY